MEFLLSPLFIGLSALSFLVMMIILWGTIRACSRHRASPIGLLYGDESRIIAKGTKLILIAYVVLTFVYIFVPPLIHDLLL